MKYQLKRWVVLLTAATSAVGCFKLPGKHNLPPAAMLSEPGPGVGGPGPGVIGGHSGMMLGGPGGMGGMGGGPGCYGDGGMGMYDAGMMAAMMPRSSQVYFVGPDGTQVNWDVSGAGFDSEPLVAPVPPVPPPEPPPPSPVISPHSHAVDGGAAHPLNGFP